MGSLTACEPLKVDGAATDGGQKGFSVKSVTPAIANIAGGTELDILGSGFTAESFVAVDEYKCLDVSLVSDREIKCTVPQMSGNGGVELRVYEQLDGESIALPFTLTNAPAPIITGFYTDSADGVHKLNANGTSKLTVLVRNATATNAKVYVGDVLCAGLTGASLSLICTPAASAPKTAKIKVLLDDGQMSITTEDVEYVPGI